MGAGCSDKGRFEAQYRALRAPLQPGLNRLQQLRELVRCASLAANGHNTQPWRFRLAADRIMIRPDFSRRTPAVDPDDHHLWVSLGCATENMVQAAGAMALQTQVEFGLHGIAVALAEGARGPAPLVDAIFHRQCTRADYDGRPLPVATLRGLQAVAAGSSVELRLITARNEIENVLEYVTQGNSAQMQDPAFVSELKQWIRFNAADAVSTGDGLFAAASGNPTLPAWLGSRLFSVFFTEQSENEKYARQLRSSAGVAVLTGARPDPASWFEVGRAYQRFALQATLSDVRNAFINQPVEVAAVRAQFASWLGRREQRPDLVLRFGTGPVLPYSYRRPVAQVLA